LRAFLPRLDIEVGEAMVAARANGRRLDAADAWIAATALLYSATLLTPNPKDYLGVSSLSFFSCA
jgi:predicted nucleic acid-binding protein